MKDLRTYIKKQINEGFKLGKNKVKKEEDDFVDLDLPSGTLWATSNVGAKCENDAKSWYGDYFMWGDPEPATNRECSWRNYKYCNNDGESLTKYCHKNKPDYWGNKGRPDNKLVLDEEDDMVNVNMGEDWKLPTKEQLQELIDNTTYEWVKDYNKISGLNGILFTSKKNDNILFIPAAGYRSVNSVDYAKSNIYIWASTLDDEFPDSAFYLYATNYFVDVSYYGRPRGFSIRGVMK